MGLHWSLDAPSAKYDCSFALALDQGKVRKLTLQEHLGAMSCHSLEEGQRLKENISKKGCMHLHEKVRDKCRILFYAPAPGTEMASKLTAHGTNTDFLDCVKMAGMRKLSKDLMSDKGS